MIEKIEDMVKNLIKNDLSGHDFNHINKVRNLAVKFALKENADINVVEIASLLHDVDDYKLVGKKNASKLINAIYIMDSVDLDKSTKNKVISIIKNMGYKNRLKGIKPKTIEGQCVSDSDMCDAIGTSGIIRSILYAVSDKGNKVIFNKDIFPKDNITYNEYNKEGNSHDTDSAINHFFEKMFKLPSLMLTNEGKKEANKRVKIMVDFLEEFFYEENVNNWSIYLHNYLKNNVLK